MTCLCSDQCNPSVEPWCACLSLTVCDCPNLLCPPHSPAALHDLDPVFREFSRNERVAGVLRSLGYKRPLPVQSMYIFKQPHIGGEVRKCTLPGQTSAALLALPGQCLCCSPALLAQGSLCKCQSLHLFRWQLHGFWAVPCDSHVLALDVSAYLWCLHPPFPCMCVYPTGRPPPGLHLHHHRAAQLCGPVVGAGGCDQGEWVPVGLPRWGREGGTTSS
jgi:hypothetical protein